MSGPFKMKGFSGFGNSPMKQGDQPHTEKKAWKKGLKEHSKNLSQELEALEKGDKLTSNIIANGGHKKRVKDAEKK